MTLRMYLKSRLRRWAGITRPNNPVLSSLGQGGGTDCTVGNVQEDRHGPVGHRLWRSKAASSDNRALHVKASSQQVTLT